MDIALEIVTFISLVVTAIIGIASYFNSKQYRESKDEQLKIKETELQSRINSKEDQLITKDVLIESLRGQITILQALSPKVLQESYNSMKDMLLENIENLKRELDVAMRENKEKSKKISELEESLKEQMSVIEDPRYKQLFNSIRKYLTSSDRLHKIQANTLYKMYNRIDEFHLVTNELTPKNDLIWSINPPILGYKDKSKNKEDES